MTDATDVYEAALRRPQQSGRWPLAVIAVTWAIAGAAIAYMAYAERWAEAQLFHERALARDCYAYGGRWTGTACVDADFTCELPSPMIRPAPGGPPL